jgi:hypothetical protein
LEGSTFNAADLFGNTELFHKVEPPPVPLIGHSFEVFCHKKKLIRPIAIGIYTVPCSKDIEI